MLITSNSTLITPLSLIRFNINISSSVLHHTPAQPTPKYPPPPHLHNHKPGSLVCGVNGVGWLVDCVGDLWWVVWWVGGWCWVLGGLVGDLNGCLVVGGLMGWWVI